MIISFIDGDALSALAEFDAEEVAQKKNITVEFIDQAPLTAEILFDGKNAEIKMYARDEMHTNSNMALHGTAKDGVVVVDNGDEETVKIAYNVAVGINKFLQKEGLLEKYAELDEKMQGVLFAVDGSGKILAKVVEGKHRPALLCTAMFGAPRMVRPYSDEIMAQFMMGDMSDEELEEAAEAGDPDAAEQLAMSYLNGDGVDEDPEKAYYWFVKAAENGSDQAMFNVGLFTAKGYGTERDFTKAAEWMEKASEAGDDDAAVCAEEYRKLAAASSRAEAGDAQAQADLAAGLMKLGGSLDQAGEGQDYEESVKWAEKSVEQGNADGFWTLALAYHHGRGVKKDIKKAIELYQKGSDAGSDACKHNLACEYMSGENIKKDTHKAFEMIKEAAENGYGLAMRDLGRCYQFANGTTGNMKKAVEWYEKALKVIDDPELAQKTAMFKMMADADSGFDEDYPETEDDVDDSNLPEGYMEALQAAIAEEEDGEDSADGDDSIEDTEEPDKEPTKEEIMEAARNGEGVIKQVIKSADGSEKEIAIWGGYELDGYDRTLNVFMSQNDIRPFIKMVTEGDEAINTDDITDPCDADPGYQMTIDYVDLAATFVLRRNSDLLSLEMYQRDERKTFQHIVDVGSGTIELEDGNLSLNGEMLQEKKFLVYALAFIGVRKYLLKEGVVQELYNMYDESAGVVIKVSKAGNISYKIVKGRERPDLPCEVFLLGEQMCRPYIDEMLGLKSSGIRKPYDPELAEKLKEAAKKDQERIAAEKAKKEEEKRKAAEEKRRKEEEEAERKAAEAIARKEKLAEAKAEYETALKEWNLKTKDVESLQKAYVEKCLNDEKMSIISAADKKFESTKIALQADIEKCNQDLKRAQDTLSNLGLFSFGAKKEQKQIIERTEQAISSLQNRIQSNETEHQKTVSSAFEEAKKKDEVFKRQAISQYPLPSKPEKPQILINAEEEEKEKQRNEIRKNGTVTQKRNLSLKERIIEVLRYGGKMTVTEIMNSDAELYAISNQKLSALIRQLVEEGTVKKVVDRKATKFYV